jgi:hypothetical protein
MCYYERAHILINAHMFFALNLRGMHHGGSTASKPKDLGMCVRS